MLRHLLIFASIRALSAFPQGAELSTADNLTVEATTPEETALEAGTEPTVDAAMEEPTVEAAMEEPTVEAAAEEPTEEAAEKGSRAPPATDACAVGDKVKARWSGNGTYYGAVIHNINSDGSITVDWNYGGWLSTLAAIQVRKNGKVCQTPEPSQPSQNTMHHRHQTKVGKGRRTPAPSPSPTSAPTPAPNRRRRTPSPPCPKDHRRIYIIRHAERKDSYACLNECGWDRANNLAHLFGKKATNWHSPEEVYAFNYNYSSINGACQRCHQTAELLADDLRLKVQYVHKAGQRTAREQDANAAEILHTRIQHVSTILVVWEHANIKYLLNDLLGEIQTDAKSWPSSDYDTVVEILYAKRGDEYHKCGKVKVLSQKYDTLRKHGDGCSATSCSACHVSSRRRAGCPTHPAPSPAPAQRRRRSSPRQRRSHNEAAELFGSDVNAMILV